MNNFYGRFKSLLLPIVALAAVAGIVQDLLLPLAKFGIKVGVAILVVGTVITLIKEQSRLGQKIKNITNNWKYPLVVSMYVLGISVISLSVVTEQSGGEKGVLASNFSALETVQASLLGIEKEIAETKRLVEENIQVTQSVKDDTDQIKSDTNNIVGVTSETLNNTNVIIQNTQKNAYERLAARGIQPNDKVGFVRSVKDSNWAEFQELMQLYQSANFNVVKNVQMPDAVLEHDYNTDKEKAMVFNAPSNVLLIDVLLMLKTDVKRLEHIIDLFDLDVRKLVSPVATAYGRNKYSQVPFEQFMRVITHPQIKVAAGEDIDFSLISHQLARDKNLHDKRGSYNLIHYVAMLNYQEYLDPLLQRGIDVNAKTHAGYTPLALALENGHLDMAEMLLERGATFEEGSSISIEIALIKALAHNNPRPSDGSTERYYPVKENPYFNFLAKHGVNQYPREIQSSVVKIYAAYLEEEKVTYSSRKLSEGATTYKDYIDWLKGQKVI